MLGRRTLLAVVLAGAVLLILASGAGFFSSDESAAYASAETGFEQGIPVLVWRALPQAFPEYVPGPGGYLAFGFDWVRGEQLPVGLAMSDDPLPRIVPADPAAPGPKGLEGARPDLAGYRSFLVSAAKDPRFTADHLMPHIIYNTRLSFLERLRYRYRVIPSTREALLRLETR